VKMNLPYLAAFSIFGDLEELLDKREGEFIGSRKKNIFEIFKKKSKKSIDSLNETCLYGRPFHFQGVTIFKRVGKNFGTKERDSVSDGSRPEKRVL